MKVIFEEYSGIIIAIVTLFLATNGPIHTAFIDMVEGLFSKTNLTH